VGCSAASLRASEKSSTTTSVTTHAMPGRSTSTPMGRSMSMSSRAPRGNRERPRRLLGELDREAGAEVLLLRAQLARGGLRSAEPRFGEARRRLARAAAHSALGRGLAGRAVGGGADRLEGLVRIQA